MGICQSNAETQKAESIDSSLKLAKTKAAKEIKLLLLGTGESGKSTIFKQLKIIHNHGFDDLEKRNMVSIIRKHCVENFEDLFNGALRLGLLTEEQEAEIRTLLNKIANEGLTEGLVGPLAAAWTSPQMQDAFHQRQKFQLADSTAHFLGSLERVVDPSYVPSNQDILACRVRTTGVSEMHFGVAGVTFRIVDVGGQRNERRKWIHCFEDVQSVIFVTAVSEYDQVLFEDDKANRLRESLRLFGEIANTRFFADTTMILFLNKKDLFEEKIKTVDLGVCFPDYHDGHSYDHAVDFIKRKFVAVCRQPDDVYVHVTCATSTGNISFVFDSVKESILVQNVSGAGLV